MFTVILISDFIFISKGRLDLFKTCLCGNKNKKFRSFKSKENIYKEEVGPYHGFSY